MEIDAKTLQRVVDRISMKAESMSVDVHPSFGVELTNYSRRRGLEELDMSETVIVLEGLTERALKRQPNRLDASLFQIVTLELCDDPFGLCEAAARVVLLDKNMPAAAAKVTRFLSAISGDLLDGNVG